jgi:uncharacterized repeat protein (TIGR01451 family)
MKRIIIRLSAVAGVIVLGLIAIAQAQRENEKPQDDTAAIASPANAALPIDQNANQPITLPAEQAELFGNFPQDGFTNGSDPVPQRFEVQGEITQLAYQEHQSPRDDNDRFATDAPGEDRFTSNLGGSADRGPGLQKNSLRTSHHDGPTLGSGLARLDDGERFTQPAPLNHDANRGSADVNADIDAAGNVRPGYTAVVDDSPADTLLAGGPELSTGTASGRTHGTSQPAGTLHVDKDARPLRGLQPVHNPSVERRLPAETFRFGGTVSVREDSGTGTPGGKQLEGSQTPSLTVLKSAPSEVQVGKPATFEISIRNSGKFTVAGVEIHDVVPKGTRLISTSPKATRGPGGKLVWPIGELRPGDQVKVQVQLMPITEGEIGSVASVVFRSEVSARTTATQPRLSLTATAPRKVMIGESVTLKIRISNTGSGSATGVVLGQNVPAALKHPAGNQLEFEVGTLAPGEAREIELVLSAVQAGTVTNTLTVQADGNLTTETIAKFEVVAPALAVTIKGPNRRYLERRATYTVSISNPGTATAKGVELMTRLPKGLKFVKANNAGTYDSATHTVYWSLDELPSNETGTVTLIALPVEAGPQKLRVETKSAQGLTASAEQTTRVEGLAAILFEVADVNDPIEVGEETTYEVRVVNQGSKASTDIVLVADLPVGILPISTAGPTRGVIEGQRVIFQALPRLAPKADTTYRIRVKGQRPGDLRIRVQLQTAEMTSPVTKEESTRVYTDE